MAKVSFDVASSMQNENYQNNNNVEFFTLVNDGDEAIVRFLYDSTESFNIMTVHTVQVGGKWRKVNCIREPQDSTDVCPLCASGNNISNRFFIHMLVYDNDGQGNIIAKPAVWERGFNYATKIKSLLDEYGPLTNELFKIKRNGAKGSMDTTYDILYCSPKVYNNQAYPLLENPFGSWTELGTIVMNKDAIAMNTFLATGSFPEAQTAQAANVQAASQPQYMPKAGTAATGGYVEPTTSAAPFVPSVNNTTGDGTSVSTGNPSTVNPAVVNPASTVDNPAANLPWMNPRTTAAPTKPTRYY